jgi:Zn ribbon nucleic-acid-binding protein
MFDCPVCSRTTTMGIPRDATIESVGAIHGGADEKHTPGKTRQTECANGHSVQVRFSTQRDLDPMVRDLQTCTRNPLNQ